MNLKNTALQLLAFRPLWQLGLVVSIIAIIYLATAGSSHSIQITFSDKFQHMLAFAELTVLARLGWPQASVSKSVVALIGFGLLIELIQASLPYREFSVLDWVADAVGIAIGLAFARLISTVTRRWRHTLKYG